MPVVRIRKVRMLVARRFVAMPVRVHGPWR